jgi:hypothetical protein
MFRLSRGGRPPKTGGAARPVSDQVGSLKQLGITKTQSSQWQKLAKIPDDEFEELLRALGTYGVKPTTAGLIRTWFQGRGRRRPASLERMAAELRKAGWVVIPPEPARDDR